MSIRLLISDLDGTLLNAESRISFETAAALKRAQQAGIRLLAATGRAFGTAAPLLQEAGICCDFVLLNGAECRTGAGELLQAVSIPAKTAQQAVDFLLQQNLELELNTDCGDFSTDTVFCSTAKPLPPLEEFWANKPQVRKIFAFTSGISTHDDSRLATARETLSSLAGLTLTSSASWNLELTARNATKGQMALWAAARLGISPDEALVFGDGLNDQSLFRAFIHTRAMGNAAAPLKLLAEQTVASNTENGVAREIDRLLSGRMLVNQRF